MKKISMIAVTAVAALSLAGSGLAPLSQSSNVAPVAYAAKKSHSHFTNEQYAVMAYLKVDGQKVTDLSSVANALTWEHHGNTYRVSLNDKTTKIKVGKTNVKVTYHKLASDGSVAKTSHKTYSKAKLAKQYKANKSDIKNIVSSAKASNSSSSASSSSTSSTAVSQSSSSTTATRTSQTSNQNAKITIAGHTFHRQNFYGTMIWVGDNGEGELGEWYANDPSVNTNQQVANQVNQANNGAN